MHLKMSQKNLVFMQACILHPFQGDLPVQGSCKRRALYGIYGTLVYSFVGGRGGEAAQGSCPKFY